MQKSKKTIICPPEVKAESSLTLISMRVPRDLLARIDSAAKTARQSRTAYMLSATEARLGKPPPGAE